MYSRDYTTANKMTREETAKIIGILSAIYPSHYKTYSKEILDCLVNSWSTVFMDYTYDQVNKGLGYFLKSNDKGFPPSPGQIINKIPSIYQDYLDELVALEEKKLISQGNRTMPSIKERR